MKGKCPFVKKQQKTSNPSNKLKQKRPVTIETSSKQMEQHKQIDSIGSIKNKGPNTVDESTDLFNLSQFDIGNNECLKVSKSISDIIEIKEKNRNNERYNPPECGSFSFISDSNPDQDQVDLNETPSTICNYYYQQSQNTSEKKKQFTKEMTNQRKINMVYSKIQPDKKELLKKRQINYQQPQKNLLNIQNQPQSKQYTQVYSQIHKQAQPQSQVQVHLNSQGQGSVIKVNRKKELRKKQINNSIMSLSSLSNYCDEIKEEEMHMKKQCSAVNVAIPSTCTNTYSKVLNHTAGINHNNRNRSSSIIRGVNSSTKIQGYLNVNYNQGNMNKAHSNKKSVQKPLVLYLDRFKFDNNFMISPKSNHKTSSTKREYNPNTNTYTNKSTLPSSCSSNKVKKQQPSSHMNNEMKVSKTITEFTLHQKYLSTLTQKEKIDQTPKADRFKYIQINKKTSMTQDTQKVLSPVSPLSKLKNYTASAKQPTNYHLQSTAVQQNKTHQSVFVYEEQHKGPFCVTSNKKNDSQGDSRSIKKDNTLSSIKREKNSMSMIDNQGTCSVKQKLLDRMNKVGKNSLLFEIQNACKANYANASPLIKNSKIKTNGNSNGINPHRNSFGNPTVSVKKDLPMRNNSLPTGVKKIQKQNMSDMMIQTPYSSNKKDNFGYYYKNINNSNHVMDDDFFNS